NNRFYQTASRSSSSNHTAIQFNGASGNDGSLISGNIIGFANSAGTGTYTLVGTAAGARFVPIYISNASTATVNSIQGNIIQNISLTGSMSGTTTGAPFAGILVDNGLANIGTVTGNVVGSTTASGSITYTATAASAGEVYGILFSVNASTTIANNQVGGFTLNQSANNSINFYGIRASTAAANVITIQSNTVGYTAAPITNNALGNASKTVGIFAELGVSQITYNNVGHLNTGCNNISGGNLSSLVGILSDNSTATAGNLIGHNAIVDCNQTNSSLAVSVIGLYYNGSTSGSNAISHNNLHSLTCASTTGTIQGIYTLAGNANYFNNMVRLGYNAAGLSMTPGINISGFHEQGGTNNYYHNSVYIGGTNVTGSNGTYAFRSVVPTATREIKNNIFHNARSNDISGTGVHHAITLGGNTPNISTMACDYNCLFVSGVGGAVGAFAPGGDLVTLSAWQNTTGKDANSFFQNPNFINPTGSAITGDLHTMSPTLIEGVGSNVAAVTDDFDGQARAGITPVDVGADAGNFTYIDQAVPTILYPLTTSCLIGDLTFTANILDATGVPTSGALQPRVYYRKNNGSWQSAQGVLSSGTSQNGTWSFTILASSMGGMLLGDFVTYYVIAQDLAGPYLVSNPASGLVAADVNNVTTPPSTLHKYGGLGGIYTVGVGGNYTTLTAAVADYNANCLGGPIVLRLIDATYPSETYPITINANASASSTNTLTIKPATGISPTLSGNNTIFLLNGADYVTIDGSNGNVANSICPRDTATRNLTIQTTGGATAQVALCTTAGGDPATNNRIMNCTMTGVGISVHIGGPTIGSGTGANGNNSNEIVNNRLDNNLFGSGTSTVKSQTNVYSQNRMKGMLTLLYENAPTIHANTLGNRTATSGDVLGMNLGFNTGAITNASTTGQEVTNASIQYNKIDLLESQSRESVCGICIAATSTGTTTVANNMVSRIASDPLAPDFGAGIFWGGGAGALNVWYNTVSVKNPTGTAITSTEPMMALGVNGSTPFLDIRNNILHGNVLFNANTTSINLGYSSTPGNFVNLTSNFNDLTTTSQSGSCTGRAVSLSSSGTSFVTLANWQAATGRDASSIRVLPNFVSATNLHLPDLSNQNITDRGTPIGITTDFDCESRSLTAPDMGADETVHFCTTAEAGTASANTALICGSGSVSLTATGYLTGAGGSFVWQSSPAGLNVWTNLAGTNPATFIAGPISASTDFRLWTSCATNSSVDSSNVVSVAVYPTLNPTLSITASPGNTICPGTFATFTANATQPGTSPTYQWKLNGSNVGTNSTTYTNPTLVTGDQITCVLSTNNPCASPQTVTSNAITITIGDVTAPMAVCQNLTVALDALGNGSITATSANNGSTDNCTLAGALLFSVNSPSFTCANLGSNLRTLTVTDANGNTGTCGLTVNVVDQTAPTAACQNITTALDGNGNASITAAQVNNASSDNCTANNALTTTLSGTTFTCANLGGNVRTLTVTDASGNSSSCAATIQVIDNIAPVATCQNSSVTLNGAGFASLTPSALVSSATDNCTAPNSLGMSASPSGLTCSNIGSNAVTVTVTDQQGNTSTCTTTVIVSDPIAPLAQCQNATVTLDAQGNGSITAATVNNGSIDNCSLTTSLSTTTFNCGDVGSANVVLTATDPSGNTSTCNAIVTVVDTTSPAAICQNTTLTLGPNGTASVTAGALGSNSSDACGIASMSINRNFFDCSDQGPNPVILTVVDPSGNTASCTAIVTVPSLGSSISVAADVLDCGFNISCHGANDGVATVSGAGGCPPITYAWSNGGTTQTITGLAAGTYTVTITDGNGATLTDTVTLTEPSLLTLSLGIVQSSCTGNPTGSADVTPTGGNACHPYTYLWSTGATTEDLTNIPSGNYTLTVTDAQGCTAIQSATISSLPAPTPAFTQVGHQLVSSQSWATYQWLLNGIPLSGANAMTYDILVQGSYTLQVTDTNGCIGTSGPLVVVGIEEALEGWSVYPNPARDRCLVSTAQPAIEGTQVRMTDLLGRVMSQKAFPVSETKMEIDLRGYAAGVYLLEVASPDGSRKAFRLVVE
ncbi:MAG: T9SS type A sorting domain-containing protein, partial [Bacteroidia bacterium]